MKLVDFIDPTKVELNVPFSSKKRLFEQKRSRKTCLFKQKMKAEKEQKA